MRCGSCWKTVIPFGLALFVGIAGVTPSNDHRPKSESVVVSGTPKFIKKPFPKLTGEARANKIEGVISLKVTFDERGKCTKVEVLQGLPFGLTEQAIAAAGQTEIEPYRFLEQNVSITTTIRYKINQSN